MFEWKKEYELGIDLIDKQHKNLFRIAREAYMLLENYTYVDKYDEAIRIVQELKDYTIYHFETEEAYLESVHYKDLMLHKEHHKKFFEKFHQIDLEYLDKHQDQYILNILDYVFKWIDHHILVMDKQY